MDINMTLIGQVIAMAVFVWFCMKFIWPLIMGAIEQRQTEIATGLAAAEKGAPISRARKTEVDKMIAAAREQARGIVDQANTRAGGIVEQAKTDGEAERKRQLEGGARRDRRRDQPRARGAAQPSREDRGRGRREGARARDRRERARDILSQLASEL